MQLIRTQTTHPSKEAVRRLMQQRRTAQAPPLTPEQIRAALDWRLLPS